MRIFTGGSSVTIDGKTFSGKNISINGDKVVVDGVEQDGSLVGPITVIVKGNCDSVETTSGKVEVVGTVGHVKTMSGSVRCHDIHGDAGTMSGNINCATVKGNAKTMSGDIQGLGKEGFLG